MTTFLKKFVKMHKFGSLESRSRSRISNLESRSRTFDEVWSLGLEGYGLDYITDRKRSEQRPI